MPYRPLRDELLGLVPGEWVARCDALAQARDLRSATGAALRFVPSTGAAGALGYEAAILHEGRIACRPSGRGAVHDLHNALVWLTFPRVKATLNRLHLLHDTDPGSGRGRMRDRLTLLDESGLLWLSRSAVLDAHLRHQDWLELLVRNRDRVRDDVVPIVIGHGLLEKLGSPYKSMTAHCLVCNGPWADDVRNHPAGVDADAASRIVSACAAGIPPRLAPLPILGLPDWDPANVDRSYYDDVRVFRSPRALRTGKAQTKA
jgi:Protein of unknown function (DUF3025)